MADDFAAPSDEPLASVLPALSLSPDWAPPNLMPAREWAKRALAKVRPPDPR
jgi:hypothetical protein